MPSSQPTSPQPHSPRLLEVTMPDNSTSQVRIFEPKYHCAQNDHYKSDGNAPAGQDSVAVQSSNRTSKSTANDSAKPLVIIWPGFGMGARYFDPMGRELATRGFLVASGELRGQGTSTAQATRAHTWGYHHLASQDYPLTIKSVKEDLGLAVDHPTVFLCHSLSGSNRPSVFHSRRSHKAQRTRIFRGWRGKPLLSWLFWFHQTQTSHRYRDHQSHRVGDWLPTSRHIGSHWLRTSSKTHHAGMGKIFPHQPAA